MRKKMRPTVFHLFGTLFSITAVVCAEPAEVVVSGEDTVNSIMGLPEGNLDWGSRGVESGPLLRLQFNVPDFSRQLSRELLRKSREEGDRGD